MMETGLLPAMVTAGRADIGRCGGCGGGSLTDAGAAGGGRSEGGPLALSLLHVSVSSPAKSVKRAMAGTVCAVRG